MSKKKSRVVQRYCRFCSRRYIVVRCSRGIYCSSQCRSRSVRRKMTSKRTPVKSSTPTRTKSTATLARYTATIYCTRCDNPCAIEPSFLPIQDPLWTCPRCKGER